MDLKLNVYDFIVFYTALWISHDYFVEIKVKYWFHVIINWFILYPNETWLSIKVLFFFIYMTIFIYLLLSLPPSNYGFEISKIWPKIDHFDYNSYNIEWFYYYFVADSNNNSKYWNALRVVCLLSSHVLCQYCCIDIKLIKLAIYYRLLIYYCYIISYYDKLYFSFIVEM